MISVVVCTRDRPAALARCLTALARLDDVAYEVVVVDNAPSDDAAARVVDATPFRYVREDRPGLDRARNRGAAEARYSLIAYTDDDVEAEPGWLSGIAAAFADPGVAGVTGRVLAADLSTPAQRLFERYGNGMDKGETARLFRYDQLGAFGRLAVQAVGVGANMAFRRAALETVGGFDPTLDVGTPAHGAGDLDLFHRLLRAGFILRYEPSARVRHHHRREMAELRRQLRDNGRSFGVYLLKRWREGRPAERVSLAAFCLLRWGPWLTGRLAKGALGLHPLPLPLLWEELAGVLSAPRAWEETRRIPI
ncbi:MAG TPA: glycosyltransferase [Thermoanaerobaculia bacterium]|nr:glycosyltransferase [Thermoanaerobaculia bacterium]